MNWESILTTGLAVGSFWIGFAVWRRDKRREWAAQAASIVGWRHRRIEPAIISDINTATAQQTKLDFLIHNISDKPVRSVTAYVLPRDFNEQLRSMKGKPGAKPLLTTHFRLKDTGAELESDVLWPGATATATITLPPGETAETYRPCIAFVDTPNNFAWMRDPEKGGVRRMSNTLLHNLRDPSKGDKLEGMPRSSRLDSRERRGTD